MSLTIHIALLGWPILSLLAFVLLRPRQAILLTIFGGWLLLPQRVGYAFPGAPDYDRFVAATIGAVIGAMIFAPSKFASVRPRWYDLFMIAWCISATGASVSNDLGLYDGISGLFTQLLRYGLPYYLGRAFFADREGVRDLAIALIVAGLVYVPPALFEVRMSPQLHRWIYGFHADKFYTTQRWGGYRPTVFLSHGIELGILFGSATLAAILAWRSKAIAAIWGLPIGFCVAVLTFTTIISRVANAWFVVVALVAAVLAIRFVRLRLIVLLMILAPLGYFGYRLAGNIPYGPINAIAKLSERRAASLRSRVAIEHVLIEHALKRPAFGWGTYRRNRPDIKREDMPEGAMGTSATDSLWIIALGQNGLIGLAGLYGVMLTPLFLLMRKIPPGYWMYPQCAIVVALVMVTYGVMINSLYAAFIGPMYFIIIGSIVTYLGGLPTIRSATVASTTASGRASRARVAPARPSPTP